MSQCGTLIKQSGLVAGALKLSALLILSLIAVIIVCYKTADIQGAVNNLSYVGETVQEHKIPGTLEDFEKAISAMKESAMLLINWAIILLGGTIGIAILAKGVKIDDHNWGLVLIGPSWVFFTESLMQGRYFNGVLTFQTASGQYIFRELNTHLFLQGYFFLWGLGTLIVLASWYLFFRFCLWEKIDKVEGRS